MNQTSFQKPITSVQISFSNARAAYVGPSLALAPHRNAVATLVIALQSPFEVEFLERPEISDGQCARSIALIPPGAFHHLRASSELALIYFDALSDDCARLISSDLMALHARLMRQPLESLRTAKVDDWCELIGVPVHHYSDPRVARVVRQIDAHPNDFTGIGAAASAAGLSASRLQALFRQEIGLPFRRYRLWRRMALVVQRMSSGQTLTAAAFAAGFSSSAHLSSSFKAMFGLTPSNLLALGAVVHMNGDASDGMARSGS